MLGLVWGRRRSARHVWSSTLGRVVGRCSTHLRGGRSRTSWRCSRARRRHCSAVVCATSGHARPATSRTRSRRSLPRRATSRCFWCWMSSPSGHGRAELREPPARLLGQSAYAHEAYEASQVVLFGGEGATDPQITPRSSAAALTKSSSGSARSTKPHVLPSDLVRPHTRMHQSPVA